MDENTAIVVMTVAFVLGLLVYLGFMAWLDRD